MSLPIVRLDRYRCSIIDDYTLGVLSCDGFLSWSLERAWLDNETFVSCIPVGVYRCDFTNSFRLKKFTYQVLDVPGRSGIRFHSANKPDELSGCIAPGFNLRAPVIGSSRLAVSAFELACGKLPFSLRVYNVQLFQEI